MWCMKLYRQKIFLVPVLKYSGNLLKLEKVDREVAATTKDEGISCVGQSVVDSR